METIIESIINGQRKQALEQLKDNILIGNLDRLPMSMINFLSNNNILLEFKD